MRPMLDLLGKRPQFNVPPSIEVTDLDAGGNEVDVRQYPFGTVEDASAADADLRCRYCQGAPPGLMAWSLVFQQLLVWGEDERPDVLRDLERTLSLQEGALDRLVSLGGSASQSQ